MQATSRPNNYTYFNIITALCTTFLLLGLVLQSRLISIGPTYISGTVFVYPLSCFLLDLIAEVYGYQYARQVLWATIIANIIFASVVAIIIKLSFPGFWSTYSNEFDLAMAPIFRTMSFGMISIVVGQFINIYAISKFRVLTKGKYFALRSVSSTMIGEIITALIALIGIFSKRMPTDDIFVIMLTELGIMFILALIWSIPGTFIVKVLQKLEPNRTENEKININPFVFKVQ